MEIGFDYPIPVTGCHYYAYCCCFDVSISLNITLITIISSCMK